MLFKSQAKDPHSEIFFFSTFHNIFFLFIGFKGGKCSEKESCFYWEGACFALFQGIIIAMKLCLNARTRTLLGQLFDFSQTKFKHNMPRVFLCLIAFSSFVCPILDIKAAKAMLQNIQDVSLGQIQLVHISLHPASLKGVAFSCLISLCAYTGLIRLFY